MKILILFLLICSFITFTSSFAASKEDDYRNYLRDGADVFLRFSSNPQSCAHDVKKMKHFFSSHDKNTAYDQIAKLCKTEPQKLQEIANNYECGCNGTYEDKKLAISIYYYLYFTHHDQKALYRLKALGEPVVTEPPTPEETKNLRLKIEKLEQKLKDRSLNPSSLPQ